MASLMGVEWIGRSKSNMCVSKCMRFGGISASSFDSLVNFPVKSLEFSHHFFLGTSKRKLVTILVVFRFPGESGKKLGKS